MLNLILMCCCAAQHIGQPYEILGMTRVRHRILPGLELSALAMLLLTLWSGLVMFMLDESSEVVYEEKQLKDKALSRSIALFCARS